MENIIGFVIKELRIKQGFTQQDIAAKTGCSRDLISKIELGKRQVSSDLLLSLSVCFQFNLINLSKYLNNYKNFDQYFAGLQLISCIENQDILKIKNLLNDNNIYATFNYGEPLLLKNYCTILVLLYIDNDYSQCLELTLSTLKIGFEDIKNYNIKISYNYYYSILLVLSFLIKQKNEYALLLAFQEKFINFIEIHFFNNTFSIPSIDYYFKKLYTILLNNLADTYLDLFEFNTALTICQKGIVQCYHLNILSTLPPLLKLKVEILYKLDRLILAKETFNDFKSICNVTKMSDYLESVSSTFTTNYPLLFE